MKSTTTTTTNWYREKKEKETDPQKEKGCERKIQMRHPPRKPY
jgi:hypothetical protein